MKTPLTFLFAGCLALLPLAGCRDRAPGPVADAGVSAPEAGLDLRLYTFDGGTVRVNQLELFSQDDSYKGQTASFADAFYVVKHPKGILMWDAGLPEQLVALGKPFTDASGAFTVSRADSVATQLAQIGLTPADIDYLALSHTHFDHSGHAEAIAGATWLVEETEYEWITSPEMQEQQPDMYNAVNDLKAIRKISGDYDVFGDGSVVIKYLPGHTPGHCTLYLNMPESGPILLSGDLYHLSLSRAHKRVPLFNTDVKQTLESMDAFEAFADSVGARVILQHSKEDFETMPKAPNYLK